MGGRLEGDDFCSLIYYGASNVLGTVSAVRLLSPLNASVEDRSFGQSSRISKEVECGRAYVMVGLEFS